MLTKTKWKIGASLIGGILLFMVVKNKYKSDNINLLLPSFRDKVLVLLMRMSDLGFDAIPFDTLRSQKQVDKNVEKGTGIKNSLHLTGAAVDIISASKGWNPGSKFWNALQNEAEKIGLTSGAKFTKIDKPHVQAIPVKLQAQYRKLTSPDARNLFVKTYYEVKNA